MKRNTHCAHFVMSDGEEALKEWGSRSFESVGVVGYESEWFWSLKWGGWMCTCVLGGIERRWVMMGLRRNVRWYGEE